MKVTPVFSSSLNMSCPLSQSTSLPVSAEEASGGLGTCTVRNVIATLSFRVLTGLWVALEHSFLCCSELMVSYDGGHLCPSAKTSVFSQTCARAGRAEMILFAFQGDI